MSRASLVFVSLLLGFTSANNDWSQPCLSGVCQYDLPSNGYASGTLKIWGPENAISDITPAAGWQIIDCSPKALQQDIRLICASGSSDCGHLYDGSSNLDAAVGKVIRLPEDCGKSPFAVVTKSWTPEDQSISANASFAIKLTNGTQPPVRALHISTSFSSIQPPSAGPVNFELQGANVPGAQGDLQITPQQQRRSNSRIFGRSSNSFVTDAVNGISSLNDFYVNNSTTLPSVNVDQSFNLVNKSVSCQAMDASVKFDLDTRAHAAASIGVAASGTIVPPMVSDFALVAGLNADIDGSLDMKASASGTLDSGKINLFSVGIPGLDFPGVLTIAPSFDIDGQATATLDLDADMTVGITYSIENAQLTFPPKSSSKGSFNIGDTPLKLSVSPSVTASGTVAAHLIPTLNFNISALDDAAGANVFLALDASASMTLTGQSSPDASTNVKARRSLGKPSIKKRQVGIPDDSTTYINDEEPGSGLQDDSSFEEPVVEVPVGEEEGGVPYVEPEQDGFEGVIPPAGIEAGPEGDYPVYVAPVEHPVGSAEAPAEEGEYEELDPALEVPGVILPTPHRHAAFPHPLVPLLHPHATSPHTRPGSPKTRPATLPTPSALRPTPPRPGSSQIRPVPRPTLHALPKKPLHRIQRRDGLDPSSFALDLEHATISDPSSLLQSTYNPSAAAAVQNVLTSGNANFGGCISVDSALDVNAGADADFFGLFNPNTKVELFNKRFEIYKKCFGPNPPKRRSHGVTSSLPLRSLLEGRTISLSCPTLSAGAGGSQESVVNEKFSPAE